MNMGGEGGGNRTKLFMRNGFRGLGLGKDGRVRGVGEGSEGREIRVERG